MTAYAEWTFVLTDLKPESAMSGPTVEWMACA
jgi:hypothetical protein